LQPNPLPFEWIVLAICFPICIVTAVAIIPPILWVCAFIFLCKRPEPIVFYRSWDKKYEIVPEMCIENPVDVCLNRQKIKVKLEGKRLGYFQRPLCCQNGCCYEIGCKSTGQIITGNVYVNEDLEAGTPNSKRTYTIREELRSCPECWDGIEECQLNCCDCGKNYMHLTQQIHGPDLSNHTPVAEVSWVTYLDWQLPKVLAFSAAPKPSANVSGPGSVAHMGMLQAIPIMYNAVPGGAGWPKPLSRFQVKAKKWIFRSINELPVAFDAAALPAASPADRAPAEPNRSANRAPLPPQPRAQPSPTVFGNATTETPAAADTPAAARKSAKQRLADLKSVKDDGLITEEEFNKKREEILKDV
jgi:hypothetical protein